ncbi:hypothetical protein L228DRAFT_142387 [Xylona heveae TC161]|uniref:Uncharacterized protein n=1 Tax=Xylona heveae (strain CBS 132557 / TC161) TaxID=1328760 RepID=A0A161TBL3_XYLHT|nr:hypothetical protein L228DRAFT_142387 [Xylona heveae TC161]KZF23057.1 hypothetical protein L228DRAFT_142387 [Xylona heveae TC161]
MLIIASIHHTLCLRLYTLFFSFLFSLLSYMLCCTALLAASRRDRLGRLSLLFFFFRLRSHGICIFVSGCMLWYTVDF